MRRHMTAYLSGRSRRLVKWHVLLIDPSVTEWLNREDQVICF
jgi:hypothetical protein